MLKQLSQFYYFYETDVVVKDSSTATNDIAEID